jgi:exopolysaccharide biosynthesis polyprenyl glycosylphosphotransferase
VSVPFPRSTADLHLPAQRTSFAAAGRTWTRRFHAALIGLDSLTAAIIAAMVVATRPEVALTSSTVWASLSLVALWPSLLALSGAYSERILGAGSAEFRSILQAGLVLLAGSGFLSNAAALDLSRFFVVVALPTLVVSTLLGRCTARWQLRRLRARGYCRKRVIVVGRGGAVLELVAQLRRADHAGLHVVAACVTPADQGRVGGEINLPIGGLDDVVDLAARFEADTVAVTSASDNAAQYLRRLSWQLEGTGLELLVAPGLVEVAGPRLHIRPFEGLPLLAVEQPKFEGWRRVVKSGMDRLIAACALIALLPVLVAMALAVGLTSPGPVLYRQERIGINGRSFTMLKFRSMVVDADQRLDDIRDGNISNGLLFKMRHDPRVTPVGRWMRRLSLDELPQLINVLTGSMSLVGPRPPLPSEVAQYDSSVSRRLLVKPGLTGLWQISGRSDLPWEEAVRLDLRYVENWSLAWDLSILCKTAAAVLQSRGAY